MLRLILQAWQLQQIQHPKSRVCEVRRWSSISLLSSGARWRGIVDSRKVIPEKLHDQCRILVRLFTQSIEFSDRIVKRQLGETAGLVGRVEDLVVEYGEVERESESDRVCGRKFGRGDGRSRFVRFEGSFRGLRTCVTGSKFGEVSVVISLHLVVEDLQIGDLY